MGRAAERGLLTLLWAVSVASPLLLLPCHLLDVISAPSSSSQSGKVPEPTAAHARQEGHPPPSRCVRWAREEQPPKNLARTTPFTSGCAPQAAAPHQWTSCTPLPGNHSERTRPGPKGLPPASRHREDRTKRDGDHLCSTGAPATRRRHSQEGPPGVQPLRWPREGMTAARRTAGSGDAGAGALVCLSSTPGDHSLVLPSPARTGQRS